MCCIIPSSLGKYRRSFKPHQNEFMAPLPRRIIYIYQVRNHKSHLLEIYIICCCHEGLTAPLLCRVASICSLCAGAVYVVLRGSPTGSITLVSSLREVPTVVVLHHSFLFGEISPYSSSKHQSHNMSSPPTRSLDPIA